jgi:hypothetical protein
MSEEGRTPEGPEPPVEEKPAPPTQAITRVKAEVIPIEKGRGVSLRSFEDLQRFSAMVHASGMAPKNMSREQIAVAIQTGMEVGLTPMAALRAIYVVNGLPAFKGAAALGMLQSRPDLCAEWDVACVWDEQGPAFGYCRTRRRGQMLKEDRYTRQQAQQAGRWGKITRSGEATPWVTDPDQMLLWRAVGRHISKNWSDLLFGFPIAEAMDEFTGYKNGGEPPPPPSGPAGPVDRPAKDPLLDTLEAQPSMDDVVEQAGTVTPEEQAAIHGVAEEPQLPEPAAGVQAETMEDQLRESLDRMKPGEENTQEPAGGSGALFPVLPLAPGPASGKAGLLAPFLRGSKRRARRRQ